MDIRMPELERIPAALALAARFVFIYAEQQLREPMRKPLLADAAWAMQQQARGQRTALDALAQRLPEVLMAEDGD